MAGKLMTKFIIISIAVLAAFSLWAAFVKKCSILPKAPLFTALITLLALVELWESLTLTAMEEAVTAGGRAAVYLFFLVVSSPWTLLGYTAAALAIILAVYTAMKVEKAK